MKKTNIGFLISGAIILGIFNLLFFVIGDLPHPASVWVSYGFIHGSFIIALLLPLFTSGKKDFARQSMASFFVTYIYFGIAFLVALIFMLAAPESEGGLLASWVIQVILLALFVLAFLPIFLANDHTNAAVARQGREARFLQNASSKVKLLRDFTEDTSTVRELDVLYNLIASSPIKSSPEVESLEFRMMAQIADLEEAVDKKNYEEVKALCTKISRGVQERNRMLQLASHY